MPAAIEELRAIKAKHGPEAYRRACIEACWENKDLRYVMHRGQLEAHRLVSRAHRRAIATNGGVKRAVLNWARRTGKSWFGVAWAVEQMLKNPGQRVPYAAMTETSVEEFIEPHLRRLASEAPKNLKPVSYPGEWVIPSLDARMPLKGCEDRKKADRLRGPAAAAFVIDEAGFIPVLEYVVKSVAAPQLITTDGMMLVMSSAPESPAHPFVGLAREAQGMGAYKHMTVYDAPHLTPQQIASFAAEAGGVDSAAWRREGLSEFVIDETRAVFPEFVEAHKDIVRTVEPRPYRFAYVVGDLGYVDLTVILFAWHDFDTDTLVVEDELVLRRPNSHDIQRAVAAKREALWTGLKPRAQPLVQAVDGPPITVGDIARLERDYEGGSPSHPESRWSTVPNQELGAAVNGARLRIQQRKIAIHPRCETLLAHMHGALWNTQRTSFERVTSSEGRHHFDAAAALVYLVRKLQPNRNPYPAIPEGIDVREGYRVPVELLESERARKLKRAFGRKQERR